MGEGAIPADVLDGLSDQHLKIFLRVANPHEWPPGMDYLRKYLSKDEQIKWLVQEVMSPHEGLLADSLKEWTLSVWSDLFRRSGLQPADQPRAMEEMAQYLKGLMKDFLAREEKQKAG
jgi:hypothetical protein